MRNRARRQQLPDFSPLSKSAAGMLPGMTSSPSFFLPDEFHVPVSFLRCCVRVTPIGLFWVVAGRVDFPFFFFPLTASNRLMSLPQDRVDHQISRVDVVFPPKFALRKKTVKELLFLLFFLFLFSLEDAQIKTASGGTCQKRPLLFFFLRVYH